nr:FAD-binding oxidoreductase [Escherichia coli]
MTTFHSLTVAKVEPETRDAVTITFAVPQPLQEAYRFRPGQHLTLKASFDGEELRRCYSICRSYLPGEISVAVKAIEGGRFSRYAREHIRQGMTLEVMVPQGHFGYQPQAERQGRYLAIAAGSGITPMLAIIATTLQTEPESQFTLIYGNRTSPEHDVSPGTGRPERQISSAFTVVVHFQSGNPRQRSASRAY